MSLCLYQAPPARCHCRPLLHKLQDQLKVTQDQFVCNMLKVQEQVDEKMSRMDRRSRHQVRFCTFSTLTGGSQWVLKFDSGAGAAADDGVLWDFKIDYNVKFHMILIISNNTNNPHAL